MPINLATELTDLRRSILAMGAAVEQRLNQAIRALFDFDVDAGEFVRTHDDEIDRMEIEIEQECLKVLALSQPVASDLRFVLAVMRINSTLERIADMARGIAKRALHLDKLNPPPFPDALRRMAEETRGMFSNALASIADEDAVLARRVREHDERVDDLQKEVFLWVQHEIPRHVEQTHAAIDILSAARKLERIADLCTNIAEDVIFLTEGAVVRHGKA